MRKFFLPIMVLVLVVVSSLGFTKDMYHCPMHPNYTSDRPGTCPICGMNLVKTEPAKAPNQKAGLSDHAAVHLSDAQQKIIGITTVNAVKQPLKRVIRASGYVSTMNDLFMLQDEYIKAYVAYTKVFRDQKRFEHTRRNWDSHRDIQVKLHQAQEDLLRFGFNTHEIEKLQQYSWRSPWEQAGLTFFKEGVNYWVVASLYEQDLGYVEAGQSVDIDLSAYSEKAHGVIKTIGQIIDPQTRTVNALIEIQNYRGELAGNMFVNVEINVELNDYVMVPHEALMDTGLRKIVFVQDASGAFIPKEVKGVVQGDNGWGIGSGIKEGDRVVSQGNFLLDSESRMQASLLGGQSND